jgi:tetratricopeptide (TPR) repeat protein
VRFLDHRSIHTDRYHRQAIIRCKKAQAVARPYNQKKKIKAGIAVEKKIKEMLQWTEKEDFGELTEELEALNNMILNMQKGILEPLLDAVETVERRMKAYTKSLTESVDGSGDLNESTADDLMEEQDLTKSQANFKYNAEELEGLEEEVEQELPPKKEPAKAAIKDEFKDPEVTVKQRNFFERLQHFFDLQAIAGERIATVDPTGKIAAMKMKTDSKGIQEKNGTFNAGYQQQDINGKPVRYLADLYVAAEEAKPEFVSILRSLVDGVPGLTDEDLEIADLKQRARATEKAQEEYTYRVPGPGEAWLYDIIRASLFCKSYKQMSDVNKWLKENVHTVECENRFAMPQFDGYRDILYYISVPYKNELAFICEIQVHHQGFRRHFGLSSHKVYFRPYFSGPFREPVESLRDLDMLLQVGSVDDQLMEFLLEATDPSQLKLFGRIFFEKLEETDKALELFKRVLTMEESSLGKGHVVTGTTYQYIGLVLLKKGDADGSLLYLREGLTVMDSNLGSEHPELATIHGYLGKALSAKGDYGEALMEYKKCLGIREEALGEDHLLVAGSYLKVAQALSDKGEFKKAMAECRTALIIQESISEENGVSLTDTHILMGNILSEQGEHEKAIVSYTTALSIREEILGKKHPKVADSFTDIGVIKLKQGKYDEAESYHRKALQIRETILGKEHADCAISYSNLGLVLSKNGDQDGGALVVLRLALKIRTKALGRSHFLTSTSYYDIGTLLADKGDFDMALNHYKECLTIRKQVFGRNHPLTAVIMNAIGRLKTKMADKTGALSEHKKALGILEKVVGGNHPEVANTYQYIAEAHLSADNSTKALENHSKALEIRSIVLGKHHPDTGSSCRVIAELLEAKGDLSGAKAAFRQAVTAATNLYGDNHADTATVRIKLGRVLDRNQEYDAAEVEFRMAVAAREEVFGVEDLLTAEAYSDLGTVLSRKSEFDEALVEHQKALGIRVEQLGESHPDVVASMKKVEAAMSAKHEDELSL